MKERYEVTIGIPVYNTEKYIRRAMDSILAQTFQSIEFLVCDDGCTDASMFIVEEYQHQHPRGSDIRIVHQSKNMGLGNARNRIIEETRSKYLYHMDADDSIAPNAIELLYNAARKNDAEIVYGSHERIDEVGTSSKRTIFTYDSLQFQKEDEFAVWAYRKYDGIQANTWNFLIDVDVYRRNGAKHQPVNFWEDFSLTIDLPTYVTRVVLLSDVTYYYYCREGSLSHFQRHNRIDKEEIERTVCAINQLKNRSDRIRQKPYFPQRMYKLMMTDFYMIATVLKNQDIVFPAFSNRELRDIMSSPLTLYEIIRFKSCRGHNLVLYLLGVLPASISVSLMRLAVKHQRMARRLWRTNINDSEGWI